MADREQMMADRAERIEERIKKAADRAQLVQIVSKVISGYYGSNVKEKKRGKVYILLFMLLSEMNTTCIIYYSLQ